MSVILPGDVELDSVVMIKDGTCLILKTSTHLEHT